jgi:hypothetical protein
MNPVSVLSTAKYYLVDDYKDYEILLQKRFKRLTNEDEYKNIIEIISKPFLIVQYGSDLFPVPLGNNDPEQDMNLDDINYLPTGT